MRGEEQFLEQRHTEGSQHPAPARCPPLHPHVKPGRPQRCPVTAVNIIASSSRLFSLSLSLSLRLRLTSTIMPLLFLSEQIFFFDTQTVCVPQYNGYFGKQCTEDRPCVFVRFPSLPPLIPLLPSSTQLYTQNSMAPTFFSFYSIFLPFLFLTMVSLRNQPSHPIVDNGWTLSLFFLFF